MNSRVRADTSKRVNRSILFHAWHRSYIITTRRNSSWYDPGYGSCNVYDNTWKIIFHNFQQYQETFLESTRYLKTDLTIVNKLRVSRHKTLNADHDISRQIITLSKGYMYKSPMYDTAVLKTLVSIFDHKRLWCSVGNFNVNVKQNARETRMDNPEKLATLFTQDTWRRQTRKQHLKLKKINNKDNTKNQRWI